MACDSSGNAYLSGGTDSPSITLNNGVTITSADTTQYDALLIKYNANGDAQWGRAFGASGAYDTTLSVTVDDLGFVAATGYFASGTFSLGAGCSMTKLGGTYDWWLARFHQSNGTCQWARLIGGPGDENPREIAALRSTGDILTTGYFNGATVSIQPGVTLTRAPSSTQNALIVRYSPSGSLQFCTYV